MSRVSRVYYFMAMIGLAILGYMMWKGRLSMAYLGMVLGFTAGFMVDASAREKSLQDNFSMAIFLAGILAYLDVYAGITAMARESLGQGFVMAMIALAIVALVGAMMDEVRVGRTVRISYLPTVAMILALLVLFQAVSVNTDVTYTWTSYPPGDVVDKIRWYNDQGASTYDIVAMPVINGSKAVTTTSPIANGTVAWFKLFIYTVENTSRVRHAGNLTMTITIDPAPAELPREKDDLALRCMDDTGSTLYVILPDHVDYNATTGVANVTFILSSIDVFYANMAHYVLLFIDVHYLPTSVVSITIDMSIHGQKVLDRTMAYAALILEGIAALLAMPEDVSRHVRRTRRRR